MNILIVNRRFEASANIKTHERAAGDGRCKGVTSNSTDNGETLECPDCAKREARMMELERNEEMLSEQLLKVSCLASKAETYVGLFHNIGNILNSVSVSAKLIIERARTPRQRKLRKSIELIKEQLDDTANDLTEGKNDSRVFEYIARLLHIMEQEDESTLANLTTLDQSVNHIVEIIQSQQAHSRAVGTDVEISPSEIIDAALLICANNFADSGVEIVREYDASRLIRSDRHKVLQILVNLISNAEQALARHEASEPRIILRTLIDSDNDLVIEISDNGPGIEQETLAKLFSFGFTTRSEGHGYGLHSSARNADSLGAKLSARSDGLGHGATFALKLSDTPRSSK